MEDEEGSRNIRTLGCCRALEFEICFLTAEFAFRAAATTGFSEVEGSIGNAVAGGEAVGRASITGSVFLRTLSSIALRKRYFPLKSGKAVNGPPESTDQHSETTCGVDSSSFFFFFLQRL